MTKFYLIRHGEPNWGLKDTKKLMAALRDFVPLTENGIKQVEHVSQINDFSTCDIIISSPYTRSLQTAAVINRSYSLPLQVEFDLHEWTPDNWTAESMEEITLLWQDYMDNNGIHPENETRIWETKESVRNRVINVLKKYQTYSKVIVVCHGMVIATLLDLTSEEIPYCGVYDFSLAEEVG
jgi:broad specificity phosphatase PhoE